MVVAVAQRQAHGRIQVQAERDKITMRTGLVSYVTIGAMAERTYRKDYRPPDFRIDGVELDFFICAEVTRVAARLRVAREDAVAADAPLRLQGRHMTLQRIAIDGQNLATQEYEVDDAGLTVAAPPARFVLETEVEIDPDANTALPGLYRS
ncbi:MAG: hypothetical protein L0H83_09475, partial [Salinisphaera sp.]|nr:hypothetical protein [Salinisphaera sp.]